MAQHYHSSEERPLYDNGHFINDRPVNPKKILIIISGLTCAIFGIAALCRFIPQKHPSVSTDLLVKTPRACSTIECFSTNCDKQLAPFLCTKGRAVSGCSEFASNWVDDNVCTESCDLRSCDLHAVVEDESTLPRHCNDCNEEQCEFLAKQFFQSCGESAPYVCLSSANTYGCASNKYVWEAAVNTTCGSCCDNRSCNK